MNTIYCTVLNRCRGIIQVTSELTTARSGQTRVRRTTGTRKANATPPGDKYRHGNRAVLRPGRLQAALSLCFLAGWSQAWAACGTAGEATIISTAQTTVCNLASGESVHVTSTGSIIVSASPGVWGNVTNGFIGSIANDGTISTTGGQRGIELDHNVTLQGAIVNTGTITAQGHAIELGQAAGASITASSSGPFAGIAIYNSGTLTATSAGGFSDDSAIRIAGAISVVTGNIVNTATGSLNGYHFGINIPNPVTVVNGSIINDGAISGGANGIINSGIINGGITNNSDGTISSNGSVTGSGYGINNTGTITGGITNSGAVTGLTAGIFDSGTIGNLIANTGSITGATGILLPANNTTINNTGTIGGTAGTAVSITGSNNALILGTGSVLNGNATSTGTGNTLQLQGSGSEDSNLTGFSSLTMAGANWTLSGALSTTGTTAAATNVQGGTLIITGTLTNAGAGGGTTVAPGAALQVGNGGAGGSVSGNVVDNGTLGGTGTIGGNVTAAGVLSPGALGNVPGTLTINGNLALASTSVLNYNLGQATVVNGPLNDLTVVGGNLTLDGTLNVQTSPGGSFDPGVYRVISYGGTLTNNGLALGTIPSPSYSVLTSIAHQVNLVNSAGLTLDFWDGDAGPADNGVIDGGNGSWQGSAGNSNWTEATGTVNAPYADGTFAIFTGAPGTVTVDNSLGNVISSGMQFETSGYVIQGSPITLAAGTDTLRVGDGTAAGAAYTATIAAPLIGPGAVNKADLGTLILTGVNTYTGGTTIEAGTLQLGNGGATGSIIGNVADNGTLAFNRSDSVVFSGVISGTGALSQIGAGTTTLTANNTYTGGTTISAGTLQLGNGGTTGSITGNVLDNGTLVFNRSNALTFAGTISGNGTVSQNGAGSTTLGGVNTYSGGTTISNGSLTGSATSFGTGAILDNAALVIDQSVDASFANAINGTGTLTKSGAGTLNLTGTGALSGPTTVAAGLLSVNGSLANSAVTVQNGASLGGNGTVGSATILSGGTVAPGNSIGTLTVNGNFVQAANSTYQAQVNPGSTASDLIRVNGAAAIASGAVLNVSKEPAGAYSLASHYTVLSATNGVTGTYTLTGDTALSAFFGLTATYDANNVHLDVTQNRAFANAAQTPNESATASALQSLPDASPLKNAVGLLAGDAQARNAFDQLSGEFYASVKTGMIEDSHFVRDAATDRMQQAFCTVGGVNTDIRAQAAGQQPQAATCNPDRTVVWTRAFGSWGHTDSDGNAAKLDRSIGGVFVGADTPLVDNWRVGVLAGYSHSDFSVNDRGSSGTSDNYDLGLYGGTQWGNLGLRLGTVYSWHNLDSNRSIAFPGFADSLSSSYSASTVQVFGDLGYRMQVGPAAVEPFVNLAYVHLSTNSFTEQGGAAALNVQSDNSSTTFSTLGARASSSFAVSGIDVTARGTLGWRHAWGSVTPTSVVAFSGSSAFGVGGVPVARDMAVIDVGLEAPIAKHATVGVSYSGQFGGGAQDNGIRGNLTWKF